MSARFISLEGGEGSGKSTQVRALGSALRDRGIDVLETREPGGSEGAEKIRELLLARGNDWTMPAEALLFAAARADHVAKVIRPALARGQWVICDRFIDSSRAYQTVGGELDDKSIRQMHLLGSGGLMPDRTFLLHLPQDEGAGRAEQRDGANVDRIGGRDSEYQQQVAQRFKDIATAESERVVTIDASASIEDVSQQILASLDEWMS